MKNCRVHPTHWLISTQVLAVASFAAFWYGIVDIWSRIGPAWGVIAAMTALALAFGFIVAGLYYGNDGASDEAERARQRYGLD